MENLLMLAEKHFGSRDLNKIFHVKENASQAEGKSVWNPLIFSCSNWNALDCVLPVQHSYKVLSLLVHPDRTSDPEATEKFQALNQIYTVLMCQEKRQMYEIEKFVLILSDEEYAKCKMHYAGNLIFQIHRNLKRFFNCIEFVVQSIWERETGYQKRVHQTSRWNKKNNA